MKLPPLTALRHFNAAARHLSFRQAAFELHVSEGAISRQIKLLEDHLGIRLFDRVYRGVKLTDAGQKLQSVSDNAFHQIADICEELHGDKPRLSLSVTTSFAIRWLMKRLSLFEATCPDIPINLQTLKEPPVNAWHQLDASIVYIFGNPYNKSTPVPPQSDRIMIEWLLPVCSPALLTQDGPLPIAALNRSRVIFNEPTGRDWRLWQQMLPDAKADMETAIKFEHDDTAIQAAVAGHGISLANLAYIGSELEMGSLVPAAQCDPLPIGAHYLVSNPKKRGLPHIQTFRSWILKQGESDPSQKWMKTAL